MALLLSSVMAVSRHAEAARRLAFDAEFIGNGQPGQERERELQLVQEWHGDCCLSRAESMAEGIVVLSALPSTFTAVRRCKP